MDDCRVRVGHPVGLVDDFRNGLATFMSLVNQADRLPHHKNVDLFSGLWTEDRRQDVFTS